MKRYFENFMLLLLGTAVIAGCAKVTYKDISEVSLNYGGSQISQRYFMSIRPDGSVRYESTVRPEKRKLSLQDTETDLTDRSSAPVVYSGTISQQEFAQLCNVVERSGFMSIDPTYFPTTGGDQTTIKVRHGSNTMEVIDQHGKRGAGFDELRNALEAIIDGTEWKPDGSVTDKL